MKNWKLLVLEHDDASEEIGDFFEKIWAEGVTRKQLTEKMISRKDFITKEIGDAVGPLEGKILTLYGDGGYHHCTYGLCNTIAKKRSKNYIYIHIDNHTDSHYNQNGSLDCASFVKNILEEPEAKDVMFIGSDVDTGKNTSEKYTLLHQRDIVSEYPKKMLEENLKAKNLSDVYCSLDLDVLKRTEIRTDYNQGMLELKHLLQILDIIKQEKEVISADMLGYNKGVWGWQDWATREVSLLTYATLAAKITGKNTEELRKLQVYFKNKKNKLASYPFCNVGKALNKEFEKITEQLRV